MMSGDGMYLHVISTGTSILRNFVRYYREDPDKQRLISRYGMERWGSLSPTDPLQKKIEAFIPRGNEVHEALLRYVANRPLDASAELNSFLRFIEIEGHPEDNIEIALYSTDTPNNRLTARIIYEYLHEKGFNFVGEPIEIRGFVYGPEYFDEALADIMDKLVRIIHEKTNEGYQVFINATAGYKPETTFIILATYISMKKPPIVYYIHESIREPIKLPAIPVMLDRRLMKILARYREPKPRSQVYMELLDHGMEIEEMIRNGLLIEDNGLVKTREWVRRLINLYGEE